MVEPWNFISSRNVARNAAFISGDIYDPIYKTGAHILVKRNDPIGIVGARHMRIAVDNQVGKSATQTISTKHTIVAYAGDSEDRDWLDVAIANKAIVVISPDLDIPNYLDKRNCTHIHWICLPQNMKGLDIARFVLKELDLLNNKLSKTEESND